MRAGLGVVCLVATSLASSAALAVCAPGDLAGRWDSYASGAIEGEAFWERCSIGFGASGQIRPGSSCRDDTGDRSALSGQFVVSSDCRLTGTFVQQFPGEPPAACEIAQGTLTEDKNVVAGVGTCLDGASLFSFTQIRH